MKVLVGLLVICILTVGLFAQSTSRIEGKVIQKSESLPLNLYKNPKESIQFKKVTLISEADQTTIAETKTDDEGNFLFENVPAGKYTIFVECSYCWRERVSKAEIRVTAGQTVRVEIELSRVTIQETVNVAAGTAQPAAEVSKTVNIIDFQEIRDRSEFSLTEALRPIPGFRLQQLGGFGKTATIKTRGLRNQDTAVLIDGVRFRDAASITGDASAFLSDIVLTDAAKVEILRGSGSSLYGTNAIGGVLDIRSREPQNGFHGSFLGEGGSLGLKRILGNVSNGNDKAGFSLGISRIVYSEGIDDEDDADNTTFNGRIDYRPSGKTNISGRFYFSQAFVRLNSNPDTIGLLPASNSTIIRAVPVTIAQLDAYANGGTITNSGSANFIPDVNDPDSSQKSKFFNGQAVLTQIINGKLIFKAHYSGLRSSRKNDNDVLGIGFQSASTSFFDGTVQTVNGHFDWAPNANHLVTFGYEYESEKYGNDGLTPNGSGDFFTRAYQASNTFYAQDLVGFFNGKLQIAGGFRAQFFNLNDPKFSVTNAPYRGLSLNNPPTAYTFDGSASYNFDKTGTKLRAHAGNGYRVPSLYERFGTFYSSFSNSFIALGDPNLKPERTIAFDGGIDQALLKNRAKLSATYFYTRLIETVGYGNVVPGIGTTARPFGGYINTEGGIARGAEFSGDFKPTNSTDVFTSYTFTNSDQRSSQVSGSGVLKTLGVPSHQFTLVATHRVKNITMNFDFLATSDYLAPIFSNATFTAYVYRFNGNRKGDLTASYTIPFKNENVKLRLFGTLGNIFGYDYYENGFRTEGRTARGGLGISF